MSWKRNIRLALACFLVSVLSFSSAQSNILNSRFSVKHRPTTFPKLLKHIGKKCHVVFSYNPDVLPLYYTPKLSYSKAKLSKILQKVLVQNGINYFVIANNTIILTKSKKKIVPPSIFCNGYIENKTSGERLSYVYILDSQSKVLTTSNDQGYFSLALKPGRNILNYSHTNHVYYSDTFYLKQNTKYKIKLVPSIFYMDSVVIRQKRNDIISKVKYPEKTIISFEKNNELPLFLGEKDMIQYLKLFPGVSGGIDVLGGLYVRGGRPEHNLMSIDDIPIYKTHHLFGLFSIFDPSSISNTELSKNHLPIDLGGRLASSIKVNSKDGDINQHHTEASIGLITAKARVEGPIIKGKTTFHVSFRRSYVDYLIGAVLEDNLNGQNTDAGYYFYDINAKVTHNFKNHSKLSFTYYRGQDNASFVNKNSTKQDSVEIEESSNNSTNWGSSLYSVRLNTLLSAKTRMKFMVGFHNYDYKTSNSLEILRTLNDSTTEINHKYQFSSGISDLSSNLGFKTRINKKNVLKYGIKFVNHWFSPGRNSSIISTNSAFTDDSTNSIMQNIQSYETSAYLGLKSKLSKKTTLIVGTYHTLSKVQSKFYHLFEPRIGINHVINNRYKIFGSISQTQQFVHLLSNPGIGLPSDIWLPSTQIIKPEKSIQGTFGGIYHAKKHILSASVFAKKMDNLLEYKSDISSFQFQNNWENQVVSGSAQIIGLESQWLFKGEKSIFRLSYTLSKNIKLFKDLNNGEKFNDKYDRLHNLTASYSIKFNKKIAFSSHLNYNSGYWITTPTRKHLSPSPNFPNRVVYIYDKRNNYHVKHYFRLDFNFNFTKEKKHYTRIWSLGIFNTTNSHNPTFFQLTKDNTGNEKFYKVTLFPLLPNINYLIRF